jgi:hypothetical protein
LIGVAVFAAFKILVAFSVGCVSLFLAIVRSGHPALAACTCGAFVIGLAGAELLRLSRKSVVRSIARPG